ncbi:MAG: hypothetical protein AVDCRST_MAG60-1459, partial [uncultured Nocardioides sp.]
GRARGPARLLPGSRPGDAAAPHQVQREEVPRRCRCARARGAPSAAVPHLRSRGRDRGLARARRGDHRAPGAAAHRAGPRGDRAAVRHERAGVCVCVCASAGARGAGGGLGAVHARRALRAAPGRTGRSHRPGVRATGHREARRSDARRDPRSRPCSFLRARHRSLTCRRRRARRLHPVRADLEAGLRRRHEQPAGRLV